ncbi:virulence plasmid B protein [Pseudomonas sp. GM18]|uniref:SpvB/TcaC N-terminal domain-containing protein n=1 Tax=Pseudomonas sp. GM18 TaxID=1144324 RepID=UPI000272302A|nr:SpvB/TcaC N-terminal domain-containing protein [Pseudomonas sp. GM18]EJM22019.1 virulence plasmid B protein [Pseudomonas sp. GM18]
MSQDASLIATPPTLPKGGGAIHSIGDKLGTVGTNGAASCEIPLPVSTGRGYAPALTLRYSSAQGNGVFGLGWALPLATIARRTTLGVPTYTDDDLFVGSDGQVWMPERDRETGAIQSINKMCSDGSRQVLHKVVSYRPRVETDFAKIEHWSRDSDKPGFWLIYSADGSQHVYGKTPLARRTAADNPAQVGEWLLEESMNALGEHICYEYIADTHFTADIDCRAQRYLNRVCYGNFIAALQLFQCTDDGLKDVRWHFELRFDYGEPAAGQEDNPQHPGWRSWSVRSDPFSDFGYGFELRTQRLCQQVLMFHHFPNEPSMGNEPVLVRRTLLQYQTNHLSYNLLSAVLNQAYSGSGEYLPPVEFSYTDFAVSPDSRHYKPFEALSGLNHQQRFQFIDLLGEGLPGVLHQTDNCWRYAPPCRQEAGGDHVAYMPWRELPQIPIADSRASPRQFLGELNGDGWPDWIVAQPGYSGFFTLAPDGQWSGFTPFAAVPTEFFHPHGQFANLMGAGLSDLVMLGPRSVRLYANRKDTGFAPATEVSRQVAEDDLPCPGNARGELVAFSDLLGSGQQQLIRIRHNEVKCWPNLGRGRFGKGRVIATLDFPYESFDASRILLADVDGSGAADLIYLQADCARIFMNRCGNSLSPAIELPWPDGFRYDRFCKVIATDLQGLGCASLVFSVAGETPRHWRYDFVDVKPYLLVGTNNNMGAACSLSYRSSAQEWLDEKQHLQKNNKESICQLPLQLPVVKQQTQYDEISGNRISQRFKYRRGFYDGAEHEFRGFGLLIQTDSPTRPDSTQNSPHSAPTLTKTWFHIGNDIDALIRDRNSSDEKAVGLKGTIQKLGESWTPRSTRHDPTKTYTDVRQREIARALNGRILRVEVYGQGQDPKSKLPYSVQEHRYKVNELRGMGKYSPYSIVHPVIVESISYQYERIPQDPRCTHTINLEWDAYGYLTHHLQISYARRLSATDDCPFTDTWEKKWWGDSHDEAQQYYYLSEHNAQFIHISTSNSRRLGLPYLQRSNALKLPKAPLADGLDPASLNHESLRVLSASSAWKDHRVLTGMSLQRYRKPDASDGFPDGQASVEGLVDYQEIAELNDVALKAYDRLKSAGDKPAVDIRQKLEHCGYKKMPIALPADDQWDKQNHLWSVQLGFTTYQKPEGFCRPLTVRASRQHGPTTIGHDPYFCLVTKVVLPDDCTTQTTDIDYRTLLPQQIIDPDGNIRQALYDACGQLQALSYYKNQSDTTSGFKPISTYTRHYDGRPDIAIENPQRALQQIATAYFYDRLSWMGHIAATTQQEQDWRKQAVAAGDLMPTGHIRASARNRLPSLLIKTPYTEKLQTLIQNAQREPVHCATMQADRLPGEPEQQIRITLACWDGFGRPLQSKQKVESGLAWAVKENGALELTDGVPRMQKVDPRWCVSERMEYDNKGQVIRMYRPYFSDRHRYINDQSLRQSGLCDQQFHDPLGRLHRVINAKGDESRYTCHPWYSIAEDENDTGLPASILKEDDR